MFALDRPAFASHFNMSRMILGSAEPDPDDATESPATSVLQPGTSYYDVSDTDDPTHQDHGVASFNVLLDVCLHLDSLKLQIEDFLLSNGINNIFTFFDLIPDDIPAMMTRKRKPPDTVGAVELEVDEIPLPGVVARAITVLLWYVHWLYHTEFKGKDVTWSTLTRKHYNEFRTLHYLQYRRKVNLAGQDSRRISGTGRTVNVTGINDHQMPDLELCTVGGVIDTQRGPVVGIMNQHPYSEKGNAIHSSLQLESYEVNVNEKSRKIGGTQSITTPDGYALPLNIVCVMRQYEVKLERRHAAPVHAFDEDAETFVSDDTDGFTAGIATLIGKDINQSCLARHFCVTQKLIEINQSCFARHTEGQPIPSDPPPADTPAQPGGKSTVTGIATVIPKDRHRVEDILRALCIQNWQSEAYHQRQNFAKRHYQKDKDHSNRVMDRSGAPPELWLHCLTYVCFVLNHFATESLHWRTPLEYLLGITPDICGVIGISDSVGHAMTYPLLMEDTKKEIHRSRIRKTDGDSSTRVRNFCLSYLLMFILAIWLYLDNDIRNAMIPNAGECHRQTISIVSTESTPGLHELRNMVSDNP